MDLHEIGVSVRREALSDVLERVQGEGSVTAPDGSVHDLFPVAISVAEGEALRERVIRDGASRTLEVGLGYGVSTLYICDGLIENGDESAMHVAVDPFQSSRFANCGLELLAEAGVAQLVDYHPEPSQLVLPRFVLEGRVFDLAFLDGDHRFDGVFVDLYFAARLVRAGASSSSTTTNCPRSSAPRPSSRATSVGRSKSSLRRTRITSGRSCARRSSQTSVRSTSSSTFEAEEISKHRTVRDRRSINQMSVLGSAGVDTPSARVADAFR